MPMRGFIDTNVIFEAVRIGVWSLLAARYDLVTVGACVDECLAGDASKAGYVAVDRPTLEAGLKGIETVGKLTRVELQLDFPDLPALDDGELHLLAHLHGSKFVDGAAVLLTADKAAIRAAYQLGWLDSVRSLESLLQPVGAPRSAVSELREQHTESWLSRFKTDIRLGVIR
jgi:hypothetical protein